MEAVFLDRCYEPALDVDPAAMRRVLVANDGIVIEASKNQLHIVHVTRVDVFLNYRRQVDLRCFENRVIGRYRKLVRAAPVAIPAVAAFAHSMSDCRERQNARTNRSVCSLPRTIY